MMNSSKYYRLVALALLLGAGMWLAGCESDTVAPHDETPELTSEDVAYQAAAMGAAAGQFLPQLVEFSGNDKNEYSYTFPAGSDISGTIQFDFRTGGADGSPATYSAADWGKLFTAPGENISFAVGAGGSIDLKFSIVADITRDPDTATLLEGSGGTFTAGDYGAVFSFADLVVVRDGDYPAAGTMVFVSGNYSMTLTFDGTNIAVVTFNGAAAWTVNLDDATIEPIG